jgi:hypothetical protein
LAEPLNHYNSRFDEESATLRVELDGIDAELDRIAEAIMAGIPSLTVRQRLNQRMAELEARKQELAPQLVPLTEAAEALVEQLEAIRATIEQADAAAKAQLLDAFVERVLPHFDGEPQPGKERGITFEFIPRKAQAEGITLPMKIGGIRRGRGSSPPRG